MIVEQLAEGVVVAEAASPVNALRVFRVQRNAIALAPEEPGIYFLVGRDGGSGNRRIYVGQSKSKTNGIRKRLKEHKKNKEFFGEVFAIPLPDQTFSAAIEAEFILRVQQAEGSTELENVNQEENALGGFPAAVQDVCNEIQEALILLVGDDIFSDEAANPKAEVSGSNVPSPKTPVSLETLIEVGLLDPNETLFGREDTIASIGDDGGLVHDDTVYSSLSRAGKAATAKVGGHPSVNGWTFWRVKRNGEMITLKSIRDSLGS